jgi:sialic acid synthase SpsE
MNSKNIFEDLFVLEVANNHWGSVDRGLKIINDYAQVVRYNNVKAAIKLQFRDVDEFVHKSYKGDTESRYIKKTEDTKLSKEEFKILVDEIVNVGCIPMATPFDEKSVELCVDFDMPLFKIASSDINDWSLIEKIASYKRPVIISTGGASIKNSDDVVEFFANRNIPLAINHCVSMYPSEDCELELNQIDFLKNRYPENVIGLSTHEYHDWHSSMYMSYAKGARTWERHVDIEYPEGDSRSVSKYCSLPHQVDEWFKAHKKAIEMSGGSIDIKRVPSKKEVEYLDALVRGIYAKKDIKSGYIFSKENIQKDFYASIPLHKGQLTFREILNGEKLKSDIKKDEPLTINSVDGPYNENSELRKIILERGSHNIDSLEDS